MSKPPKKPMRSLVGPHRIAPAEDEPELYTAPEPPATAAPSKGFSKPPAPPDPPVLPRPTSTPQHRAEVKSPHKPPPAPDPKRRCHRCHSTGRMACPICNGKGEVMQGVDFNGNPKFGPCAGCFGLKTARCSACSGEGFL